MNRNRATGRGVHTPDGCAVELYKLLAARNEPDVIHGVLPDGCDILELGAGVGRVTHGLIALGHAVTAVDFSAEMLAEIRGAETICADIAGLDLDRRFAGVVLGSTLINVVEDELRAAFLQTCARHVTAAGSVVIECHGESLFSHAVTGLIGTEENGVEIRWLDVSRNGMTLTGTLEYRMAGDAWTQSFSTRFLDRDELRTELQKNGLELVRFIDNYWIEVRLAGVPRSRDAIQS